jgi:hypothetical protein
MFVAIFIAIFALAISSVYFFFVKKDDKIDEINYNNKTKLQLINCIRMTRRRKLNQESSNFASTLTSYVPKYYTMIAMCLELYDTLKTKALFKPREKQTDISKTIVAMKKKVLYIRPNEEGFKEFNESVNKIDDRQFTILDFGALQQPTTIMENGVITNKEFVLAFKDIKIDDIDSLGTSDRMLQNMNDLTRQFIINKYNELYLDPSQYANDTSFGKLCFVHKGDKNASRSKIKSFRQIICIPKIIGTFHRIMTNRLVSFYMENNYIDTTIQKGVMPGSKFGIPEHLYKVKSIFRNATTKHKQAYVLFIDITNAFGSLRLEQLYSILAKYNVSTRFIDYIREYYKSFEYYTEMDKITDPLRKWDNGLIQGTSLSPILFVSVMNYMLVSLNKRFKDTHGYALNKNVKNLFTAYIDDICITCNSYDNLNEVYTEIKKMYKELGFEINDSKSGFLSVNDPDNHDSLDGIKKIDMYKYLGEYITDNASPDVPYYMFLKEMWGKLMRLDEKKVDLTVKANVFVKCIWPWIQRKGIAFYDIGNDNKQKAIDTITGFTDKWNVTAVSDVCIDTMFRNIKSILGDSNDKIVSDIIDEDDSEYIKGNNAEATKFLSFKKYTRPTNFTYNNINETEIINDILNNMEDNDTSQSIENVKEDNENENENEKSLSTNSLPASSQCLSSMQLGDSSERVEGAYISTEEVNMDEFYIIDKHEHEQYTTLDTTTLDTTTLDTTTLDTTTLDTTTLDTTTLDTTT